ncbi:MAG: hypothetical protein HW380_2435 [Magnetococcales bacterium]|nr:hypothetical protein [Magnetococcales bacterium]
MSPFQPIYSDMEKTKICGKTCLRVGKISLAKNIVGVKGGIIPPGGGLEAAAHKVFLLTLILILLPPKGGLGIMF